MKKIRINLMTKLLTCSIIVVLVLAGVVYISNKHIVALNNSLAKLDAQHDNLKDIEHLHKEDIKPLIVDMMEHTQEVKQMAVDVKDILFKGIIVLGITSIILGIIATLFITLPIKKLMRGTREIADGDLTTKIEVNTKDEIEELADIFNWMTTRLRNLIREINEESEQVNGASQQLSAISQEVATVTEKQADSTEENLVLLQDFNDLLENTAQKINVSTKITTETKELAIEGAKNNNDLVTDMKKIDLTTQQLDNSIEELNTKAEEINNVVRTIDDIAEQTNILALNAAIEAARSSKEGQGFAVVAEEIRELAANVKKSTIEIKKLVKDLQLQSNEAVKNSNNNYKLLKKGMENTFITIRDFNQIKDNVNQLANEMLAIKEVTKEEEEKLGLIVNNNEMINEVVRELALNSKNTANSAEELKKFAENLEENVKEFDI